MVANCNDYEINFQTKKSYVAPHDIECYKCHNYGHIVHDCRSTINPPMIENTHDRYKKVWKRSEEKEENSSWIFNRAMLVKLKATIYTIYIREN